MFNYIELWWVDPSQQPLARLSSGAMRENSPSPQPSAFFKITKATLLGIRIYKVTMILLKFSIATTQVKFTNLFEPCF